MKLLALEARQNATYYQSRYQQVQDFGAELYVLNGIGTPDFWPADRYRVVGSQRIDDLITEAKSWHEEERSHGLITFSESAVTTVAAVAEALGLPGVGAEAARTSRNKLLMREAHREHNAPHPDFRFVADLEEALGAATDFGYPVILKPTLGAASNFVFKIDDREEMEELFPQALSGIEEMSWFAMEAHGLDLGPHGLLVESFLDGEEFLIEAVAWDGEVYLGSIVDRITVEGGTFDDDMHHAPTSLTPEQVAAVHRVVRAGAHAQGLRRSVMHAEIRFHRGEPYLLEIAIRPGGGGLDLIAQITASHNPIRAVMDVARGSTPRVRHYRPTGVHVTAMCLISDAGRIASVDVPIDVAESERVFFLKVTAKPGDVIRRPPEGNSILGFLGTTGTSLEDARETMLDYASKINVSFVQDGETS
jgi:biotin carboxylase